MKVKNLNASSSKTKQMIRSAFLEMLSEKGQMRKISVSELVRHADIDRTTFYTHYADIYEIAEEMEAEILEPLCVGRMIAGKSDVFEFFREACQCFEMHWQEFTLLLASDEQAVFLRKPRQMVLDTVMKYSKAAYSGNLMDLRLSMYVNGFMDEHIRYFNGKSSYSYPALREGLLSILADILDEDPSQDA